MHLVVGQCGDTCCAGVLARLVGAWPARPHRRFAAGAAGTARLAPRRRWADEPARLRRGPADEIAGVLVRGTGWVDPAGWAPDGSRLHAGGDARRHARLARGLSCPVINRHSAAMWYRGRDSLSRLAPAAAPLRASRPRHSSSPTIPPRPAPSATASRPRHLRRGLHAADQRGRLSRRHRRRLAGPRRAAGAHAGLPQRAARRTPRPASSAARSSGTTTPRPRHCARARTCAASPPRPASTSSKS